MWRRAAVFSTLFAAAALGCGSDRPAQGHERGACYLSLTCEPGLTCLSNFCVRVPVDGSAGASGSAGAGGGNDAGANPGTGGGGTAGATGGAGPGTGGATGGRFEVAPHSPDPQVAHLGGPVLTAPKLRPIFFVNDPDEADIMAFFDEVAAGSYWSTTTSEYGVGPLRVLDPVVGAEASEPTLSDQALRDAIADNTGSASAPWGPSDPNTLFLFVLPPDVGLTFGSTECCVDYPGYHDETIVNGMAVPYAVSCACPGYWADWPLLDQRTALMSHSLIATATNPFPRSNPAYYAANQANLVWNLVTGGELPSMCMAQLDAGTFAPGGRYVVQRSWSNQAARIGNDPCVPSRASPPYFNSMPVLDIVPYGSSGARTQGLEIPVGSSRGVELQLFSAGPVPNGWTVTPYALEDLLGGAPSLTFSLDKNTGQNGDVLHMTITAMRSNPALGGNPFVIRSTIGSPGDSNYRCHVSMGLVTTR